MIGTRAEKVLNRAIQYAVQGRHEFFTLEHVLWSLLQEARVVEVLELCNLDVSVVRKELEVFLAKEHPASSETPSAAETTQPMATLAIQRLVQRALFQVQSSGRTEVAPEDLLVALFQAKESQALYLLRKNGLERLEVLEILSHGDLSGDEGSSPDSSETDESGEGDSSAPKNKSKESLEAYAPSLNARARAGKIDALIGRQTELERMIQVLMRRRKNNPLLLGEAGVGKTALVEGLALRVVQGQVPSLLKNAVIYSLDMGALTAGTRYRGDFEARVRKVVDSIERKKASGEDPILFIDEIHTLVGAGAVGGGSMDASNLLKPLLARGELRCIGSTTYGEYRAHFEKDSALSRRFQKIDVVEPTQEQTVEILLGQKEALEKHHGVTFSSDTIKLAVELSVKHITDRFLPDKALDVLDEVGARVRLAHTQATPDDSKPVTISARDIEEVIAQMARIPAKSVTHSARDRLKSLDQDLKLTLFGQDEAIGAVATAIRLARSGLRSGERPVGSFLFCGPTGVGKTELSKQLANVLGIPFLRFDMSEYGEKHTVSRLIGAPPGYVGFEQAGQLTDAVMKSPHSVVVLDEIEKAHPDIWNILLQVMDHGRLTDNNGRKIDFRNVILILTSNVGSRELERTPMGMGAEATALVQRNESRASARVAVEKTFTPEFRNRLDAVLIFDPLTPESMSLVVSKQLVELETQALAQKVDVETDERLKSYLARKGYNRSLGARPLTRLIQDEIKKPLANAILFGELEGGGRVKISTQGDGPTESVSFVFSKAATRKGPAGKKLKKPGNPRKISVAF